jgi:transcription elongation GreA/GreB family factor
MNSDEIARVVLGGLGTLRMEPEGEVVRYRIVGEEEGDIPAGRLSVSAPLARALLGWEEDGASVLFFGNNKDPQGLPLVLLC